MMNFLATSGMLLLATVMEPCKGYTMMPMANHLKKERPIISNYSRLRSLQARSFLTAKVAKDASSTAQQHRIVSSKAGVKLADVSRMLDDLYPPSSIQSRNAQSRTDGYWRYVQQGKEPPMSLTYGEFDLYSLASLLEVAMPESSSSTSYWEDCVFTDIGSGTGRIVMAAAALHRWRLCRGIELLPGIHGLAVSIAKERDANILIAQQGSLAAASQQEDQQQGSAARPFFGSAVELCCGSFDDEAIYFGDSDFIFSFSTCMNGPMMDSMGRAIRRQCQPGTIVVTTDYRIPESDTPSDSPRIRLLKEIPTYCKVVGGECTAFLHQVVE